MSSFSYAASAARCPSYLPGSAGVPVHVGQGLQGARAAVRCAIGVDVRVLDHMVVAERGLVLRKRTAVARVGCAGWCTLRLFHGSADELVPNIGPIDCKTGGQYSDTDLATALSSDRSFEDLWASAPPAA